MSRNVLRWIFASLTLVIATPALAFAEDGAAKSDDGNPGKALVVVVLYVLLWIGIGAAMALLRVIVPRVADAADASVRRLGTARLLVAGVAPLVGALLIAVAVGKAGIPALGIAYALVVVLPLSLAVLAGATAALPRVGEMLLKDGEAQGLLKRSLVGGLVLGLAGVTAVFPPLAGLLGLLVAGWFLGIGVGTVVRPPAPATSED